MKLVEVDKVEECVRDWSQNIIVLGFDMVGEIMNAINSLPTIEADPVVHGEWEETDWVRFDGHDCIRYFNKGLRCSVCCHVFKKDLLWNDNYCPNCGAKMDGKKEGVTWRE